MRKLLLVFLLLTLNSCGDKGGLSSHSALCNDGTYSDSANCSGTCSWHGGVKEWYIPCGSSSSTNSLSIMSNDSPDHSAVYSGSWIGTWTNKNGNQFGTMHLSISENSLIEGIFLNNDISINSKIHSYIDVNGTISIFIDSQQYPDDNIVEYPGNISLKISHNQLTGTISLQKAEDEEVREFELYEIKY